MILLRHETGQSASVTEVRSDLKLMTCKHESRLVVVMKGWHESVSGSHLGLNQVVSLSADMLEEACDVDFAFLLDLL